jgi:Protein of unknown function (DUF2695)
MSRRLAKSGAGLSYPAATITAMDSQGHVVHTWSGRACRLPISRPQFQSLLNFVDEMLAMQGCDNTHAHAQTWARAHGVPWAGLSRGLRSLGGFCDCEIGMNAAADDGEDEI